MEEGGKKVERRWVQESGEGLRRGTVEDGGKACSEKKMMEWRLVEESGGEKRMDEGGEERRVVKGA